MRVEEDLEESEGKLYTRDLVVQDCNSYIKQVSSEQPTFYLIKKCIATICNNININITMEQQLKGIDISSIWRKIIC